MKHFSRLLTFVLTLMILPQMSFAHTNDLKAILDDYTYSMSVEWDQNDKAFAEAQNQRFEKAVRALVSKGLSKEDVKAAFKTVNAEELEAELGLVDLTNPVAVANFISMKKASSYSTGASWAGKVPKELYVALLIAAVITLGVILAVNKPQGSECLEYNNNCFEKCETQVGLFNGEESIVCYDFCDTSCKYYK